MVLKIKFFESQCFKDQNGIPNVLIHYGQPISSFPIWGDKVFIFQSGVAKFLAKLSEFVAFFLIF